jgi:hypothetical protein
MYYDSLLASTDSQLQAQREQATIHYTLYSLYPIHYTLYSQLQAQREQALLIHSLYTHCTLTAAAGTAGAGATEAHGRAGAVLPAGTVLLPFVHAAYHWHGESHQEIAAGMLACWHWVWVGGGRGAPGRWAAAAAWRRRQHHALLCGRVRTALLSVRPWLPAAARCSFGATSEGGRCLPHAQHGVAPACRVLRTGLACKKTSAF